MLYGAIPMGTKIYLEDRTLVKVEDLTIGSKLLSLKVEDDTIKNSLDFYYKYVFGKDSFIPKSSLSFDSAIVSQINLIKGTPSSQYYKTMYYNNPIIVDFVSDHYENKPCLIMSHISDNFYQQNIDDDRFNFKKVNYGNFKNFISFKRKKLKSNYLDEILYQNNPKLLIDEYTEFSTTPYYSISLLNNYIYFTENLCLVGIVPKIKGESGIHLNLDLLNI